MADPAEQVSWWATQWKLYGNQIGAAVFGMVAAAFYAGTRWLGTLNDKAVRKLDKSLPPPATPPPPALPAAHHVQLSADFEAATIALTRERLEVERLHGVLRRVREEAESDLRRQRLAMDELEKEDGRKAETITSLRALIESARAENATLRSQIEGSRHGTETGRFAHDPDRDRRRGQPLGGGWPVAREEVGPPARGHVQRKGSY